MHLSNQYHFIGWGLRTKLIDKIYSLLIGGNTRLFNFIA